VVDREAPSAAETALNRKDYAGAEGLFRAAMEKDAGDGRAHEGLVRALIEQDKVADAAKEAEAWAAATPGDSMALTALGDVRLRQGDPRGALIQYAKAKMADLCNARAYYGLARVEVLEGLHATGKKMIEQAYMLHPTDDDIQTWWMSTRPQKERMQEWAQYAEHSSQISEDDRAKLKTQLEKQSLYHATDCRATPASPREATVPMAQMMDGPSNFLGWGLDVQFDGKRRRLQIDTGASGIMISRAAAMFLGIQREDETQVGGIGDTGKVRTSIAHVASIKIGGIEFTNCPVEILEKWSVLDSDGLIGGDVFSGSLLTLDFPKHELRVAPLPERPGEKQGAPDAAGDNAPAEAHDPYVAPEMAKWQPVYRVGHDLLVRTGLVDTKRIKDESAWKEKLFLLDTGAGFNTISPDAAEEVTKVSRDYFTDVRGVSGDVKKVFDAGRFTLVFAGLRLDSPNMTAIDTTKLSHDDGVEVSGLIGAPALFQVALHIDYRDNLVWCEHMQQK
jgi:predicted aspartyl protease